MAITDRSARRLALGVDAVTAFVWVFGVALLVTNRARFDGNAAFLFGMFGATALAYAITGTMIIRRQPSNVVAWLCLAIGPLILMGLTGTEYAVHARLISPGSLPAPAWILALAEPSPILAIAAMVMILHFFPDGHALGRRWLIAAWGTVGAVALGATGSRLTPHAITDVWSDRLEKLRLVTNDPFGVHALSGVGRTFQAIGGPLFLVGTIVAVASLFVRRRRADADTRAQLRWLAYVVVAAVVWILVMVPIMAAVGSDTAAGAVFWIVVTPLVALGPPIAIGIAILRYRLWDIDVVIKKTLIFAVTAGGLAIVSFLVLLLVPVMIVGTGLSGWERGLFIVGIAIGTLFGPLRRRARRLADRLVYGRRATPYEVLTEFSGRIGETYVTDDVLPRMAQVLAKGTGATSARVLLRVGGELREVAAFGDAATEEHIVPIVHQGEELGALAVTMPPNDPMNPSKEKLVADLAAQAGFVLRNVRLIEELRESRRRIVAAQDERAKQLERNIHDGAQQQLVALAVKLRLTKALVAKDPAAAEASLDQLQADTTTTLEDLRDLARGIYPPLLADKGLASALQAQARKAVVPTVVESDGIGRYPQQTESTVYFCVLEALNNIAKYAEASHATVDLAQEDGRLAFTVVDDGLGFDPTLTGYGTGMQGMADRLDAIGGTLAVVSAPGEGTTVSGQITLDSHRGEAG
ncbi:MAG: histidine kinase [Actinomycetota bacterium]|nr:histidine kinase [Actinomycetota bacterium]